MSSRSRVIAPALVAAFAALSSGCTSGVSSPEDTGSAAEAVVVDQPLVGNAELPLLGSGWDRTKEKLKVQCITSTPPLVQGYPIASLHFRSLADAREIASSLGDGSDTGIAGGLLAGWPGEREGLKGCS